MKIKLNEKTRVSAQSSDKILWRMNEEISLKIKTVDDSAMVAQPRQQNKRYQTNLLDSELNDDLRNNKYIIFTNRYMNFIISKTFNIFFNPIINYILI